MGKVSYLRGDEIIEVIIRDSSGKKLEVFRCNGEDDIEYTKILKIIYKKYGYKPLISKAFEEDKQIETDEQFKF